MLNKLPRLSAAESRQIIDEFRCEVFDGLDPGPAGAPGWAGAAWLSDNPVHAENLIRPGGSGYLISAGAG